MESIQIQILKVRDDDDDYLYPQALGSHGNSAVEVDRDTAERMGRIQASYRTNRDTVLNELLRHVCEIKPEFHANYRVAG